MLRTYYKIQHLPKSNIQMIVQVILNNVNVKKVNFVNNGIKIAAKITKNW
jgi:hypothetical protein